MGMMGNFPGDKWLGHEDDYVLSSSAKFKKEGTYICTSMCLHGMQRYIFTFTTNLNYTNTKVLKRITNHFSTLRIHQFTKRNVYLPPLMQLQSVLFTYHTLNNKQYTAEDYFARILSTFLLQDQMMDTGGLKRIKKSMIY
jgi:hypothetical protein